MQPVFYSVAHVKTECNYSESVEGGETRCPAYGF